MNSRTLLSLATLLSAAALTAQAPNQQLMPPDYRGVQIQIPGVYVTPVPNAPFTANVEIISHQKLPNGTENVRTTTNFIARDSSGRIYNERRQLVPVTFKGQPILLSAHIYDPATRLNIYYEPATRIARESVSLHPPVAPPNSVPGLRRPSDPNYKEIDLGDQSIDGTTLHGIEKQRIIPAPLSTTGETITITDEYWYSPDLSVYLIVKHNDPRTGEQIVAVTHIDRHEPPSTQFAVPAIYKLVDETPPPIGAQPLPR